MLDIAFCAGASGFTYSKYRPVLTEGLRDWFPRIQAGKDPQVMKNM